ncbi:MAG TPA: hypothetical protein VFQ44_14145, partial [Streptosporangiaceae bacterium]|nr:hypothetical protein [Streptosporangiaceae bacterium]
MVWPGRFGSAGTPGLARTFRLGRDTWPGPVAWPGLVAWRGSVLPGGECATSRRVRDGVRGCPGVVLAESGSGFPGGGFPGSRRRVFLLWSVAVVSDGKSPQQENAPAGTRNGSAIM